MDDEEKNSRAWDTCLKNKGHEKFVPVLVSNLDKTLKQLPQEYQTQDVSNYIETVSDLTVKLTVSTRQENTNGAETTRRAFGSGWVRDVQEVNSLGPPQGSYRIYVKTAYHVIFDDNDTDKKKSIAIHFFYNHKKDLREVKKHPIADWWGSKDTDNCQFCCDIDLVDKQLYDLLKESLSSLHSEQVDPIRDRPYTDVAVIVSHPHGEPKYITVTEDVEVEWNEARTDCDVQYKADTCPGSSGGPVILMKAAQRGYNLIAHSGVRKDSKSNRMVNHSVKASVPRPWLYRILSMFWHNLLDFYSHAWHFFF